VASIVITSSITSLSTCSDTIQLHQKYFYQVNGVTLDYLEVRVFKGNIVLNTLGGIYRTASYYSIHIQKVSYILSSQCEMLTYYSNERDECE